MASTTESWAERWYRGHWLFALLLPLSLLFQGLVWLRRRLYAAGWLASWQAPVPVLVVGNITVGGAGKTPMTLALVERLQAEGWRPGIVSRGYGGEATYPHRVRRDDLPARCGDEPLLLARRSGVPVVVDPQRVRGVQALLAETDCNVVICDDGLQHLALGRDIEVVVVDGQRGLGSGWLLPAGPLRELPRRLTTADFVVRNGAGVALRGLPVTAVSMQLQAADWQPLDPAAETALPLPGQRVHAIAGIGHPERFFASLRRAGFEVVPHAFPDHHAYRVEDLVFDEALPLVMTEKDAVKCTALALQNAWFVPVSAHLPETFWNRLLARLAPEKSTHAR